MPSLKNKKQPAAVKKLPVLQYECDQCGACCRSGLHLEISKADMRREPRLQKDFDAGKMRTCHCGDGLLTLSPCRYLTNDRCSIYATKPKDCTEFEAGGFGCQRARDVVGLAPLAPLKG